MKCAIRLPWAGLSAILGSAIALCACLLGDSNKNDAGTSRPSTSEPKPTGNKPTSTSTSNSNDDENNDDAPVDAGRQSDAGRRSSEISNDSGSNSANQGGGLDAGMGASGQVTGNRVATVTLAPVGAATTRGFATFVEADGSVTVNVGLTGAPVGARGVHVHLGSDCTAPMGHFNPDPATRNGELDNVMVNMMGAGTGISSRVGITLEAMGIGSNGIVGRTLNVHGLPMTLPNGMPVLNDAGMPVPPPIVACGVIQKAQRLASVTLAPVGTARTAGRATFVEVDGAVTMTIALTGAPVGARGVHVHLGSDCTAPMGHFNPDPATRNGEWDNVMANMMGVGAGSSTRMGITLEAMGTGSNGIVGRTLNVHGLPMTLPNGMPVLNDAGMPVPPPIVACGVIQSP